MAEHLQQGLDLCKSGKYERAAAQLNIAITSASASGDLLVEGRAYANLGRVYNALNNGHAACDAFARALYRFQHCGDWQREAATLQLLLDQLASSAKSHGAKSDTSEIQGHLYRYAQLLQEHPGKIDTNSDFRRKLSTWQMHLPRLDIPLKHVALQASIPPPDRESSTSEASPPSETPSPFRQASASGEEQVSAKSPPCSPSVSRRSSLGGVASVDDLPVSDLLEHSFTNIPFADVAAFHDADTRQAHVVLDLVAAQARMARAQQDTTAAAMGSSKLRHLVQPPAQALWHQYMLCASASQPDESASLKAASRLHAWQPTAAQAASSAVCSDSSWLGSALKAAGASTSTPAALPAALDTLGLADPGLAGLGQARSARVANEELLHGQNTASQQDSAGAAAEAPQKESGGGGGLFGFSWGGSSKDSSAAGTPAAKLLKEGSVKSDTRATLTNSSVQRCATSMASFALRAAEQNAELASSVELAHVHLSDLLRVQASDIPTQLARAQAAAETLRTAEGALLKAQTTLDAKAVERSRLQQQCDDTTQLLLSAQKVLESVSSDTAQPAPTAAPAPESLTPLQAARASSVKDGPTGRAAVPPSPPNATSSVAIQPAAARKHVQKLQASVESLGRAVASATTAVDDAMAGVQKASEEVAMARQRRLDICRDTAEAVHAAAVRRGKAVEDALAATANLASSTARVSSALAAIMADAVGATSTLSDIACFTHMARVRHLMHLHNAQAASQAEILSARANSLDNMAEGDLNVGADSGSDSDSGSQGGEGGAAEGDISKREATCETPPPKEKRSFIQRIRRSSKSAQAKRARSAAAAASVTRARLVVPEAQSRSERTAVSSQYASDVAALNDTVDAWVQALLAGEGGEAYDYGKVLPVVASDGLAAALVAPPEGAAAPGGQQEGSPPPITVSPGFKGCIDAKLLFSRAAGRALFLKFLNFYRTSGTLHRAAAFDVDQRAASQAAIAEWLETVHCNEGDAGDGCPLSIQPQDAFHRLGRAMWWLLDAALVHCDLGVARSVMILAETFGCIDSQATGGAEVDGSQVGGRSGDKMFLQRLVAHHRVWSNAWIWEELFHRSIRHDVHRLLGVGSTGSSAKRGIPQSPTRGRPAQDARELQVQLLTEWPSTYTNHLFSHLGSFSLNMRLFCVPERMVNTVIARLAASHGLPAALAAALAAEA